MFELGRVLACLISSVLLVLLVPSAVWSASGVSVGSGTSLSSSPVLASGPLSVVSRSSVSSSRWFAGPRTSRLALTEHVPGVPTDLLVTSKTPETVSLQWSAPATAPAPTGYEVRVNAGVPTALGLVLTTTLTGLTPATAYDVEVRSLAGVEPSPWVLAAATTDPAPPAPTGSGTEADPTIVRLDEESTALLLLTSAVVALGVGARVVGSFGGR